MATFGDGKIYLRTFLDGAGQTVGGEGKEFFASGRNWPLPGDNWRVEVTPPAETATARFLNFLQVGDHAAMVAAQPADTPEEDGTAFTAADGKHWTVRFKREGPVGGSILCADGDSKTIFEKSFATSLRF